MKVFMWKGKDRPDFWEYLSKLRVVDIKNYSQKHRLSPGLWNIPHYYGQKTWVY